MTNSPPWPKVFVITTAWNQLSKTEACLQTVGQLDYPDFETILVDNGQPVEFGQPLFVIE